MSTGQSGLGKAHVQFGKRVSIRAAETCQGRGRGRGRGRGKGRGRGRGRGRGCATNRQSKAKPRHCMTGRVTENGAHLWLALHKLVQEGGQREVSEWVPIIADVGAGKQGLGKGCNTGMDMPPKAGQFPPTGSIPATELWLPANTEIVSSVFRSMAGSGCSIGFAHCCCCTGGRQQDLSATSKT